MAQRVKVLATEASLTTCLEPRGGRGKTAPESCLNCTEKERERKVRGVGRESDGLGYRNLNLGNNMEAPPGVKLTLKTQQGHTSVHTQEE